MNTKAFLEGYASYYSGLRNPYSECHQLLEWLDWEYGWNVAMHQEEE